MTEFQAITRKNAISVQDFRDWAASAGIDVTNSRVILFSDPKEPTQIEKLIVSPDPSSADQRTILLQYPYLQKGIVTPDTR